MGHYIIIIKNNLTAEGFIKPNGSQVLEEIGEGYLKDLIERNLILVGGLRKNEKIGSCGIHDLLRDLCIKVAEQQEFFHVSEDDTYEAGSWRRLICWNSKDIVSEDDTNEAGSWRRHSEDMVSEDDTNEAGSWRRLICWNSEDMEGRIPLVRSIMTRILTVGQVNNQELLRVFNCQDVVDSLAELYRNVNLRYLAYHCRMMRYLWELPSSASLVWNLQTLIIKGYYGYVSIVVSAEFFKMRQLRHVECDEIYVPGCNGGDEMLILENLQTLKTAVNVNLSEEVCKSIPNIKKLCLSYDHKSPGYDDCMIENLCNLGRLDKLESLKMEIGIRIPQLNEKLRFPSSLNKLCLINCQLEWEDVTVMVGSLPQLQVLMLESYAVRGSEWSPVEGQFQHLKFLEIHNKELEHWDADHFHFPVLEKLLLCDMWKLKEIPEGIGDITTLELIRVKKCSMSAAISAIRIKEDQSDYGNDSLQIEVIAYKSWVEDFKERAESEGLSLSKIQLEIGW